MLVGDFFTILETQNTDDTTYIVTLQLNPLHPIFAGHFPDNPIVPGVCLTQMVTEIIDSILKESYQLLKADSIKFTAIVNPQITPELTGKFVLKISETKELQAEVAYYSGETTFYKFKGRFLPRTK